MIQHMQWRAVTMKPSPVYEVKWPTSCGRVGGGDGGTFCNSFDMESFSFKFRNKIITSFKRTDLETWSSYIHKMTLNGIFQTQWLVILN
jgi:hypothetical protein